MDIRDLEIDCDGCRGSMGMRDKLYCEDCLDGKDYEIDKLQKKVEALEGQIAELKEEINALMV